MTIRLGIQQRLQRQGTQCILSHGGLLLLTWLRLSHLQFSQIRRPPVLPICAKDSVRHLSMFCKQAAPGLRIPRQLFKGNVRQEAISSFVEVAGADIV